MATEVLLCIQGGSSDSRRIETTRPALKTSYYSELPSRELGFRTLQRSHQQILKDTP